MKKKISLVLIALMLLSLLAACGSSSAAKDSAAYVTSNMKSESAPAATEEYGYYYQTADAAKPMEMPVPEPEMYAKEDSIAQQTASNAPLGNVKLIYTGSMNLETTEFDATAEKLSALVSQLHGYFENTSVDNYSNYRYASYTVRVPAENFDAFCSQAGQLCHLTYISRSAQDISESYYDTESRLVTQQTKLKRLQELLEKAENMEDIITLESAISETEWNIENLTGTLRHYDSLVGYSTIYVSLNEVYKLTEVEEPVIGFGAKLAAAFKTGCTRFVDDIQYTMLRAARNWVGLLIFLVIAVIVLLLIVRFFRRRKRAAGKVQYNSYQAAYKAPETAEPKKDETENK